MRENNFSLNYIRSEIRTLNCTWQELTDYLSRHPDVQLIQRRTLNPDYYEIGFPAQIYITNNTTHEKTGDLRKYILNKYHTERVSERQAERLLDELNQGKVSWFDLLCY